MRIWVILVITVGFLFSAFKLLQTVKFDTVVQISVKQGLLKGLSIKLLDYKVSYNDLQIERDFWDSKLGKAIFKQLSLQLQAAVIATKKYVDVEFCVNYAGLLRRHYKVIEDQGRFDVIGI